MSVTDLSTANVVNSTSDTSTNTSSTQTADMHTSNSTSFDNHLNSAANGTYTIAGSGTVKPNMQSFLEGPNETKERETLLSTMCWLRIN